MFVHVSLMKYFLSLLIWRIWVKVSWPANVDLCIYKFAYGVLSLDLQSFSFEMERMFIIVSCILLFLPFGAFWNVWTYVLVWSREENCCSVKMFIFIPISMCDVCLWMYFTVENKILYWQIQASALCSSWLCSIAVVESPDWNYFSGIHCVH